MNTQTHLLVATALFARPGRENRLRNAAVITGALLPSHMEDLEGKLRDILVEHSKWVESGGRSGKQADFSRHDLREKDLRRVSLGTAKVKSTSDRSSTTR